MSTYDDFGLEPPQKDLSRGRSELDIISFFETTDIVTAYHRFFGDIDYENIHSFDVFFSYAIMPKQVIFPVMSFMATVNNKQFNTEMLLAIEKLFNKHDVINLYDAMDVLRAIYKKMK